MQTKSIGIILLILGIVMITYSGFDFVTTEKVVNLGPIEINKEKRHPVQWSPIFGIALLTGGILTIVLDKKIQKVV